MTSTTTANLAEYQQFVEAAYEGILVLDRQGYVTFVNRRLGQMLGYSIDEMLGRSVFDFVDPSAHAEAYCCIEKRWLGVSEHHELRLLRKDGSVLWTNIAGSPLYTDGVITGALAIASDLTQRKAADARLLRLARWQALASSINEAIARTPESRDLYQSACRLIVEHELASLAWVGAFTADYTQITVIARHGRDNGFIDRRIGELLQRSVDGKRAENFVASNPVMINREPSAHADNGLVSRGRAAVPVIVIGSPLAFMAIYTDEQEWLNAEEIHVLDTIAKNICWAAKAAEQAAEHRSAQAKIAAQAALLDKAKDAIVLRNLEGIVDYWSKGAERLYGWSREEAVGRNVTELISRDSSQLQRPLERLFAAGEWSGELEQTTKSGATRFVDASWTLVQDEQGRAHSLLSIESDITEKKQLEAQFLQAQRLESVGTLAGGIAHDFNNIIAAIQGNARLAITDLPTNHPVQMSLAEIDKASSRAADLVRQILTFSRQQESSRRVIFLEAIVEETLRLLNATLPANIEIGTHWSHSPAVLADPIQIHQIMMNLGTNAAHAMASKGGRLQVALDSITLDATAAVKLGAPHAGLYALLTVKDSGHGMDDDVLARVFEPFFTTKPPGQGSGLGLSVVHGIMHNHEGAIAVETAVGYGTTFRLYFPAADGKPIELSAPRPERVQGNGKHILYVDDEESLVFLVTRALERMGYRVTGYTSPLKALAAFRANATHFDAVVTDLAMPGMGGSDLARELLRLNPQLPVIILSGHIRPEDEQLALAMGARELVQKPNTIEELGRALHRALVAQ